MLQRYYIADIVETFGWYLMRMQWWQIVHIGLKCIENVCNPPFYKGDDDDALQHTATHCKACSTLQHTTTPCIALPYTATHSTTLPHAAPPCNTLQRTWTLQHCYTLLQHPPRRKSVTTDSHWHAATRCNTLQHAATRCNTLHHTVATLPQEGRPWRLTRTDALQRTAYSATSRNTLQHVAAHCKRLQHTATHRCTAHPKRTTMKIDAHWRSATPYNTLQHTAIYCNTLHQSVAAALWRKRWCR